MKFLHAVLLLIAVTSMLIVSLQNVSASTLQNQGDAWSRWESRVVCDVPTCPDGTPPPCQIQDCQAEDPCSCPTGKVCSPEGKCVDGADLNDPLRPYTGAAICVPPGSTAKCVTPGNTDIDTDLYQRLCVDIDNGHCTTTCGCPNRGEICIGGSCVPDEDGQCPPCPECISYLANPGDLTCTLYDDANPLPVDKISCDANTDCSSPKPYCELPDGVCVACRDLDDCPPDEVCVNGECTTTGCSPCNDPQKPACLHVNNNLDVCVACVSNNDCPSGEVCKTSDNSGNLPLNVCVECVGNNDCPSDEVCKTSGNVCLNVCVECVDDTKCGNCEACTNNICVDSSGSQDCAGDNTKCGVCYAPPVCGASTQCDGKIPGTSVNGGICNDLCIFEPPLCQPPDEWLPKGDRSEFGDDCLAGSTACCCDDVLDIHNEENKRERETDCNIGCSADPNDWPGFSFDSSDRACCDDANDAVYEGKCFSSGRTHNIDGTPLFVSAGKWYDCDSHNSCVCRRINRGEDDVGEYEDTIEMECCGDDPDEHYRATRKDTADIYTACCNDRTDCVDLDGSCVSHGELRPSVYPDTECFCIAGAWICDSEICTLDTAAHSREIDSMTCQP